MPVTGQLFLSSFDRELVGARCGAKGNLFVDPDPGSRAWGYFADMTNPAGGELHAFDFPLFYRNIRLNVLERVTAWLLAAEAAGGIRAGSVTGSY